ncbi:hypothetical protein cypCar_00006236, partial [Cyprinus carpio]
RAGYLWPGLNTPVYKDGSIQKPSQRGETEQKEVKRAFNVTAKESRKRSISSLVAVGNGNGAAGFALGRAADKNTLRKVMVCVVIGR